MSESMGMRRFVHPIKQPQFGNLRGMTEVLRPSCRVLALPIPNPSLKSDLLGFASSPQPTG